MQSDLIIFASKIGPARHMMTPVRALCILRRVQAHGLHAKSCKSVVKVFCKNNAFNIYTVTNRVEAAALSVESVYCVRLYVYGPAKLVTI